MELQNHEDKSVFAREYHTINGQETILVYDVENTRLIQLSDLEWRVLETVKEKPASTSELKTKLPARRAEKVEEAVGELIKVDMLGNTPFGKISPEQVADNERKYLEKLRQKKLMQVSLNVTHKCNLHCDYCYGEDGSYGSPAVHMSRETARQAVDFLFKENGDAERCRITLFGGEPLLNFDLVKYVIQYARKKASSLDKIIEFGLTTNGILMDEEKADFLINEKIEVTFSLDGPKKIHDQNRPLKSNRERGSYDVIYPNILKYIEKAERDNSFYAFRATLTRPGIRNMCEMIDFFEGFNTEKVIYDTAEYKHGMSPNGLAINDDDLLLYKQQVKEIAKKFVENKLKPVHNLFAGPFGVLKNKTKRHSHCISAGVLYVGVSAEGDIYPCHRFVGYKETKLGDVWQGYDREKWLKGYSRIHIFNSKVCSSCWLRYYCGGLCPATNYYLGGDMVLSDTVVPEPVHCRLKKIVFEEAMLLRYRLSKNGSNMIEYANEGG
jgi:uncharacterized protein